MNLDIRRRLVLGFVPLIGLLILISVINCFFNINNIKAYKDVERAQFTLSEINAVERALIEARLHVRHFSSQGTTQSIHDYIAKLQEALDKLTQLKERPDATIQESAKIIHQKVLSYDKLFGGRFGLNSKLLL